MIQRLMLFYNMRHFQHCCILTVLAAIAFLGESKRYCREDTDCQDLGSLSCIRSACSWGVCGCTQGKASKYLGSTQGYGCVPMKKIGESCSNPGNTGVCAASNSYCNEATHRCTCQPGYVSVWGGEKCAPAQSTSAGETCSDSIGECELDGSSCRASEYTGYWYEVVTHHVPTCACRNNERLILTNMFVNNGDIVHFPSKKYPVCISARIGDMCLKDADCPSNAFCNDGQRCECDVDLVKDYWGFSCKKPLAFAANCDDLSSSYHCDGTLGMTCGDMCDISETIEHNTCVCGPAHTTSGTFCSLIQKGDACNGDLNCHGFSDSGYCDNGQCTDGVAMATSSMMHMALMTAVSLYLSHTTCFISLR